MIGLIGLGNMGRAIAERLIDDGAELVVWNRSPEKIVDLEGVRVAKSPSEVAVSSRVTLSVLANDAAIKDVYFGGGGILSENLAGRVVVEMCTTSPERTESLEAEVERRGGQFLECPVGGTIGPARQGRLLGLAGGKPAAFEAARHVLEKITRRLEYLGPIGNGASMKLAINLPLMVYWSALGESFGLVLDRGIEVGKAADILADSSGAIGAAKNRVPPIRDMIAKGDPGDVSLSLQNGLKDMRLMEELAQAHGRRHEVISAARNRAEAAADSGFANLDTSLIAAFGQKVVPSE
ncbi:MAG: NAD(P)-dependent oxidoreductase [Albidovulum sp.]|nr:NAD(P)-dependent oxidoreductase [Albidovulum sp.]MDE0303971.1 NAD(P)-dependent oxidoreductase [Albidovulum sp.]